MAQSNGGDGGTVGGAHGENEGVLRPPPPELIEELQRELALTARRVLGPYANNTSMDVHLIGRRPPRERSLVPVTRSDLVAAGVLDQTLAMLRRFAVENGHTLDRLEGAMRQCPACSALGCLLPDALERLGKGAEPHPSPDEVRLLAMKRAPSPPPPESEPAFPPKAPAVELELLQRALALFEVVYVSIDGDPRHASLCNTIASLHDEFIDHLTTGKSDRLFLPPSDKLVSSTRVEVQGSHALIGVWNRGGLAGHLTVNAKDARFIAARLEGNAHREEATVTARLLAQISGELERWGGILGEEIKELAGEYGETASAVLEGLKEELEDRAVTLARASREIQA